MTKGIFQALSLSPAPPSPPHFSSFILSSFQHSHFQTLCPSIVVSLLVSYLTILSLSFFTCQSPRLEVWLIILLSFSSPLSSCDILLKTPGLTQQDISASIFSLCLSILRSALPLLSCFCCLILPLEQIYIFFFLFFNIFSNRFLFFNFQTSQSSSYFALEEFGSCCQRVEKMLFSALGIHFACSSKWRGLALELILKNWRHRYFLYHKRWGSLCSWSLDMVMGV